MAELVKLFLLAVTTFKKQKIILLYEINHSPYIDRHNTIRRLYGIPISIKSYRRNTNLRNSPTRGYTRIDPFRNPYCRTHTTPNPIHTNRIPYHRADTNCYTTSGYSNSW